MYFGIVGDTNIERCPFFSSNYCIISMMYSTIIVKQKNVDYLILWYIFVLRCKVFFGMACDKNIKNVTFQRHY